MPGFKSFRAASNVLAGVELMHMIRKGQFAIDGAATMSVADQFHALTGLDRPDQGKRPRQENRDLGFLMRHKQLVRLA
jgi:hypothetical protein